MTHLDSGEMAKMFARWSFIGCASTIDSRNASIFTIFSTWSALYQAIPKIEFIFHKFSESIFMKEEKFKLHISGCG